MANKNQNDAWKLELSKPQKDAEESKPDEAHNNSQALESGIDRSRVYTPNITPEIPKSQWKDYILQVAREATHISETRGQVYMLVRKWDEDNNPRAPALDLAQLTEWAIETWAPHFK
jgi:hypothetical protein